MPILAAALLGLLVGAAVVGMIAWARLEDQRLAGEDGPDVARGVGMEILSALESAVVLLDNDDEVLRASHEAYSLGLVRNDQLVQEDLRALVAKVRTTRRRQSAELRVSRSQLEGASVVRLDARVAPLPQGVVLVLLNDTTERLRLEETRRDFVANVSHELKTPVGAIALLAETVEECADEPDTVRHFASRMRVESARLTALVRDIIDLSRLQSPESSGAAGLVDVSTVVREALDSVRVAAEERRVTVVAGGARGEQVIGDRSMLTMAVRNLLDNAVRHSYDAGRVSVGVSRVGDEVRIAVVDQGEGIAPEHQARVFERFYRADPARSRETGGTGLGLSIVKHVAGDHGGRVTLWSVPGRGATFTIVLPAADPAVLAAAAPSPNEEKR